MAVADDYSLTASPDRLLPVAVHGEGCRIRTADGREYLDACGGAMVMSLGHRHPRLVGALRRQADALTFTYRFAFANEPMADLAGLLRGVAPMPRAWSFFNSSGSESVESAIHLALLHWRLLGRPDKTGLLARHPSYHGSTVGALGLSGSARRAAFEAVLAPNVVARTPNADLRDRLEPAAESARALAELDEALERSAGTTAAVFVEPVTGASAAAAVPPDGYLQGVRELCDRHEALMVCDETITGFGRTGRWFGVEHWGVAPDVITFAKGITSGVVPFSGMIVTGDVADVFMASPDGFPVGHTFSGYPLGCAVAAEAVRVIRDDGLVERAAELGARLRAGLDRIAEGDGRIGEVRGLGLLQGLELVDDRASLAPRAGAAARVAEAARDNGLMVYPCPTAVGGRVAECLLLAPPLVATADDIDQILDRLADAIGAA